MDIVKQLGELLLNSVPTIICFLVVWGAYRVLVYGKLHQVLSERHARTEGAIQQAQAEIAAAETRTAEYEQKLRDARAQVYAGHERYRSKIMEQRSTALDQVRKQAEEKIASARATVEQELATAKAGLQTQVEALADQIIHSILKPAAAAGGR
jgi:F-type H+-transporting ATPase subunit b